MCRHCSRNGSAARIHAVNAICLRGTRRAFRGQYSEQGSHLPEFPRRLRALPCTVLCSSRPFEFESVAVSEAFAGLNSSAVTLLLRDQSRMPRKRRKWRRTRKCRMQSLAWGSASGGVPPNVSSEALIWTGARLRPPPLTCNRLGADSVCSCSCRI